MRNKFYASFLQNFTFTFTFTNGFKYDLKFYSSTSLPKSFNICIDFEDFVRSDYKEFKEWLLDPSILHKKYAINDIDYDYVGKLHTKVLYQVVIDVCDGCYSIASSRGPYFFDNDFTLPFSVNYDKKLVIFNQKYKNSILFYFTSQLQNQPFLDLFENINNWLNKYSDLNKSTNIKDYKDKGIILSLDFYPVKRNNTEGELPVLIGENKINNSKDEKIPDKDKPSLISEKIVQSNFIPVFNRVILGFILSIILIISVFVYNDLDSLSQLASFSFTSIKMKENKPKTKTKSKTKSKSNENLFIDNDRDLREDLLEREKEGKFLKDGYSIEEASKETKNVTKSVIKIKEMGLPIKEMEKPLKIIINGLVFNKIYNDFWMDHPSKINIKEIYDSIQGILLDIHKIDSKGFVNNTDLSQFPVISKFINHFTDKEVYIKGNKVTESYKWILNVLMTSLYEYTLKIMYKIKNGSEMESDVMVDFEVLVKNIFSRIDPSIRIKLQKRGISILQNIYTGFDTEYVNKGDPKLNELLSVSLAVNTKSLLRIPKYSEYELSTIDTLTGEVFKLDKNTEDFNFNMVENSLNRSIKEIRFLKYRENDASILILIKGLQYYNIPFIEKEDSFVFTFPRSPVQPFIYYNEGKGYSFLNMVNQSNLIGEPYLKEDYEKITSLLKKISKEIHFIFDWKEKGTEVLKAIEIKEWPEELPEGLTINNKKTRSSLRGIVNDDKISVTKVRNNYFIAHLTNADLSIMNDMDSLKEELNIVNKSFVTLGKPLLIGKTNVYIRDTMLLAPQGCRSLESIGSLYGDDFRKVDIAEVLKEEQKEEFTKNLTKEQIEKINLSKYIKENMDLLLKIDKGLFEKYAIQDAIIPLIHACYTEDFNFKYHGLGIPLTLSSLGATYVKYKWKLMGYKGYQLSNKYLLGDSSATQTPKGLLAVSEIGLKIPYYIANYKGGRNECYMYGVDEVTYWIDYDLTSAYTTAMAGLGNPDYNKGRMITVKQLEKMSFNEILYSYIIMKVKFKFNSKVKYPTIPVHIDETTSVYPLEGEAILTGSEYILAKSQKCELKISDIYYLPFEKDKGGNIINQPFKALIKEIQAERRKHPKGSIGNLFNKEMANSQYGNTARGISNKKKFDIKTGKTLRMDSSELCNPIIASWTTAFIRSIVGECLDKISKLKGKVVSATTDGFITNIQNLEYKLIGGKAFFLSRLKYLERKIIDDYNFLTINTSILEEEINKYTNIYPNTEFIKEYLNKFTNLSSNLIEEIQKTITDLKWEGDESLVKEYRKLRLELSQNDTGLEIKKEGPGIIAISTRIQIGKNSGIKATTGFQTGNYSLEELHNLFKETLKKEDKSWEFIQFSLRSALDIYREGGHVTPVYKDQIFRLLYDNKREIIIPKGFEDTIDISNILLDSNPVLNKDVSKTLRFLSKFHKLSIYSKGTSVSSGNRYKNYTDLAVRNFIKGWLSNPPKYNIIDSNSIRVIGNYSELIEFIKSFDSSIKLTKQSISNLKNRKMIFKTVPRTKETMKFIDFVKEKYPDFDEDSFFVKKSKESKIIPFKMYNKKNKLSMILLFIKDKLLFIYKLLLNFYKNRWVKLVIGLLTVPLLFITGFIEAFLFGGFINNPENWIIGETESKYNVWWVENESIIKIILYLGFNIIFIIILSAIFYPGDPIIPLLQSMVRDQSELIAGQKEYQILLEEEIRRMNEWQRFLEEVPGNFND